MNNHTSFLDTCTYFRKHFGNYSNTPDTEQLLHFWRIPRIPLTKYVKQLLSPLKIPSFRHPYTVPSIKIKQFRILFSHIRNSKSSSTECSHMGYYILATESIILFLLLTTMMKIPIQWNFPPYHWKKISHTFL